MKIIYLMIGLAISQLSFAHGDQHKKMNQQASFQQEEWGIGGTKNEVNRTIAISMGDDMKFKPEKINIKVGETIRFEIKNNGKLLHEMVIGTKQVLDKHAEMMAKASQIWSMMSRIWRMYRPVKMVKLFGNSIEPGTFDFACLIAGHYQAGMVGKIEVTVMKKILSLTMLFGQLCCWSCRMD